MHYVSSTHSKYDEAIYLPKYLRLVAQHRFSTALSSLIAKGSSSSNSNIPIPTAPKPVDHQDVARETSISVEEQEFVKKKG
jgi:hypothetical protein